MLLDTIRWEALNLTGWPAWRRANSLEDMGAIVIRWLEGSDRFLPWHIGPPDPETAEIIEPLIALNLKGLMTTNSQPGIEKYGWKQRAWVHLLTAPDAAKRLFAHAEAQGLIVLCQNVQPLPLKPIPITLRPNGRVLSFTDGASESLFLRGASKGVAKNAWEVTLIDPEWGRKQFLWDTTSDFLSIRGS